MSLSLEKIALLRAVGELAFVTARTDGMLTQLEKKVFREAVQEELGSEGWAALDRFDHLDGTNLKLSPEQAYNRALFAIRQNRKALTPDLIERFIALLEKVAGVSGISEDEIQMIERFQADVEKICREG
ncbi:MAG: hypothetical protein HC913_18255 [Microscillaceae bacterium]|nr:hypothetical protein [Microscillaceae bacterium]